VVDALYHAALDGDAWAGALELVIDACGGAGATLELHDRRTRELLFFSDVGMPEDGVELYTEHYHDVCPRLPWGHRDPVGTAIYDYRFLDEAEMRRLEFYEDFLARHDFRYMVGGVVANRGDRFGVVAVHRTTGAGHADDATIEAMTCLLPQVARALEVHRRLLEAGVRAGGLLHMLETLTLGALLLSDAGEIVAMNDEARRLCDGGGGLVAMRGRLIARDPGVHRRLCALRREGGALMIDPRGHRPLSVVVAPLPRPAHETWLLDAPRRASAAVFMQDPTRSASLSEEVLATAYDLTPAEIDLARAMVAGASVAEHADRRGVSVNTVRTQLKRLRAKLDARTQADLVRRLSQLMPPARTHHPNG